MTKFSTYHIANLLIVFCTYQVGHHNCYTERWEECNHQLTRNTRSCSPEQRSEKRVQRVQVIYGKHRRWSVENDEKHKGGVLRLVQGRSFVEECEKKREEHPEPDDEGGEETTVCGPQEEGAVDEEVRIDERQNVWCWKLNNKKEGENIVNKWGGGRKEGLMAATQALTPSG